MVDTNSIEELVSARNLAEVDLRTSREQLSQALAQLRQAQEHLAKTEIRSPLDGKVTAIYVKVGQTAVPSFSGIAGSTLVDVADTTSIDAEINVDETDIARVRVGSEARVVPAAFPDKTLLGTVDQVAIAPRQLYGQNKSYPVRIRLTNTEGVIFHPGMSCRAEVLTGSQSDIKVLAVPVQALRYEDNPDKSAQGGEVGCQHLHLRRGPCRQAHCLHGHCRRQLHRRNGRLEGKRAGHRRPREDSAVPAGRREGGHQA